MSQMLKLAKERFKSSNNIGNIAILIFAILIISSTITTASFSSSPRLWLSLGRTCGLLSLMLMLVSVAMSTRSKGLIKLWGNLPRLYIWHHIYGGLFYIFAILHPVFLSLQYMPEHPQSSLSFWYDLSNITVARALGTLSLIITTAIIVITLYIKIPYHIWKKLHRFLGFSAFIALMHGLFINSHIKSTPLLLLLFISLSCFVFIKYIGYSWLGSLGTDKFITKLVSIELKNNINIIKIKSKNHNIACGQFVYISLLDISPESHPLSVVSIEGDVITLMAKQSGDWTKRIWSAQPGSIVLMEGPYGDFHFTKAKHKRQVWISGGIGITPFLGQIKEVSLNHETKVDFFIALNSHSDNIFSYYLIASDNITYHYFYADNQQKLSFDDVKSCLGNSSHSLLLCTPPSMQAVIEKGAKKEQRISEVISEKFEL